ncbi:hypothetical protein LIA77_05212 [Sarocladium implicatum]|nr:hypothetical protein LIA77_05212 [Sarocladium implicatum]
MTLALSTARRANNRPQRVGCPSTVSPGPPMVGRHVVIFTASPLLKEVHDQRKEMTNRRGKECSAWASSSTGPAKTHHVTDHRRALSWSTVRSWRLAGEPD